MTVLGNITKLILCVALSFIAVLCLSLAYVMIIFTYAHSDHMTSVAGILVASLMAAFIPLVGAFVCGLLAWRVIKPASQTEVAADEPYQWSDADMETFKKLERQHALAAAPPPRHPSGAELVPDAAYQKVSKDPEEGLKKSELPVTRERK